MLQRRNPKYGERYNCNKSTFFLSSVSISCLTPNLENLLDSLLSGDGDMLAAGDWYIGLPSSLEKLMFVNALAFCEAKRQKCLLTILSKCDDKFTHSILEHPSSFTKEI